MQSHRNTKFYKEINFLFQQAGDEEDIKKLKSLYAEFGIIKKKMNQFLSYFAKNGKTRTVKWILQLSGIRWKMNKRRAFFLAFSVACNNQRTDTAKEILAAINQSALVKQVRASQALLPFQYQTALRFIASNNFSILYDLFPLFLEFSMAACILNLACERKLVNEIKDIITNYRFITKIPNVYSFMNLLAGEGALPALKYLLLEKGISYRKNLLRTPFMCAVQNGKMEVIKFLLNHQPDIILEKCLSGQLVFKDLLDTIQADSQQLQQFNFSQRIQNRLEMNKAMAALLLTYGVGICLEAKYVSLICTEKINTRNCIMIGAEINDENLEAIIHPNQLREAILNGHVFPNKVLLILINHYLAKSAQIEPGQDTLQHPNKRLKDETELQEEKVKGLNETMGILNTPYPLRTLSLWGLSYQPANVQKEFAPHLPNELNDAIQEMSQQLAKFRCEG